MAPRIKDLGSKPDNLSMIPEPIWGEERARFPQVVLWPLHAYSCLHTCTYVHVLNTECVLSINKQEVLHSPLRALQGERLELHPGTPGMVREHCISDSLQRLSVLQPVDNTYHLPRGVPFPGSRPDHKNEIWYIPNSQDSPFFYCYYYCCCCFYECRCLACMPACSPCVCSARRGQKRVLEPLELKLQMLNLHTGIWPLSSILEMSCCSLISVYPWLA